MSQKEADSFFRPLGEHAEETSKRADAEEGGEQEEEKAVQEIESLCLKCHENGITRLMLTYIPYFREVIVVSFHCDHCGNSNNEIQSAGMIQEKGSLHTVHCTVVADLDRQLVKSEYATVRIPEFQLEIPPKRGQLTTIEGLLADTIRDLEMDQPLRKHVDPETWGKIDALVQKMRVVIPDVVGPEGEEEAGAQTGEVQAKDKERTFPKFTVQLEDPSGNSFIEFDHEAGLNDPKWSKREYPRSKEQNETLGLTAPAWQDPDAPDQAQNGDAAADGDGKEKADPRDVEAEADKEGEDNEEIYHFPSTCSSCNHPLETLMKKVNIPYFKDVLIMSTNCANCGYRDSEVKSGTAISEKGRKLTLRVEDAEDLSRDILKSETAGLSVPEIDLNLAPGTLGGRFTTLEGLLNQVYDELSEKVFMRGDSTGVKDRNSFETFLGKLKDVMSAAPSVLPYTVIVDDPLANSYIQNPYAPDPDEQIVAEWYERSHEQNEDLGLNDIKVEGYEEEHAAELAAAKAAGDAEKAAS